MVAKILIRRRFKVGKKKEIFALFKKLRSAALSQPGYISGETLLEHNDPQHMLVITTWENIESWHTWINSSKRKEFDAMMEIYQDGPTEYEEYLLGASLLE
ncbi:MAG: antibiotic biosynthesis monooxygenase family protein [Thermodesulfobacteriota bacterium]|nr:antibiotic biosynthesis monooxygenase family protein [Thermodesulfobacteriota bacterium]